LLPAAVRGARQAPVEFVHQGAMEGDVVAEVRRARIELRLDGWHPPIVEPSMARLYKKGPPRRAFRNTPGRGSVLRFVRGSVGLVGHVLRSVGGRLGSVGGGAGSSSGSFVGGFGSGIGGLVDVGTDLANSLARGGGSGFCALLGSV